MAGRSAAGVCRFIFSADLNVLVRCKVDKLFPHARAEELIGDEPLDIEADLVLDGVVFSTAQSSQAVFEISPQGGDFRPQKFVFAIKVRDLPLQCSLVLRLSVNGSETYRGVLPLFSNTAVLRQGRQLLALLPEPKDCTTRAAGEGSWAAPDWAEHTNEAVLKTGGASLREALRLAQAVDLYRRGCLPATPSGFEGSEDLFARTAQETLDASGHLWLNVHLPTFPHPVVFAEPQYGQQIEVPAGLLAAPLDPDEAKAPTRALRSAAWLLHPLRPPDDKVSGAAFTGHSFKCLIDADAGNEHPAVLKGLRLARSSQISRVKDREARPNTDELRRLNEIIARPRRYFKPEERHLLFRFRWSLLEQPGALTKFLHAVDWSDLEEHQHAVELMSKWSPVGIDDALELLSKDFRGVAEVRQHAVSRLEHASDDDLKLYLLQLVQALRYEPVQHSAVGGATRAEEETTPAAAAGATPAPSLDFSPLPRRPSNLNGPPNQEVARNTLTGFLIGRAAHSPTLATLFYWYVSAETDDRERGAMFEAVRQQFLTTLGETPEGEATRRMLERQAALRKQLLWCERCAKAGKRDRIEKKVELLRRALASEPSPGEDGLSSMTPLDLVGGLAEAVPLPVDPSVSLVRVLPEKSFLLKSQMYPAVLTCEVRRAGQTDVTLKKVMVKEGDDLRQDQLILQLVILMDSILKKYGLDLQLTPYQVIALSTIDGMVEFVPDASNLSTILKEHNNDIQQFFRAHHPHGKAPEGKADYGPHNSYGIKPEVLENFIRSSAGYCVITYILGIGDRHLDNLMVTKDGRLFHIDFGFILGKDPKPFPPPMRICKEMVEGMGGNDSPGYQSFKAKCCQAYKILRRHAKLIINLLHLMTDSGIKDLCGDPQFAILKVEQKFQATMDDEQAEVYFLNLIEESVSALFPAMMERLHQLAIAIKA